MDDVVREQGQTASTRGSSGKALHGPDALPHELSIDGVSHYYGQSPAVVDVELVAQAGSFVSLLGPSGCGKTTLLRIIAGFLNPTRGDILVDGESILGLPASRRRMGIVFQNYALFPHMTVFENVAYGLRAQRAPAAHISTRVGEMLELVQLAHLAQRRPGQLSGGQQQRIALARALAVRPRILLLDEPLSALDKNLRLDMQIEIKRIQREFGITTIMVTHDQHEAMTMSDRIAVMSMGRVQQFASPTEIYDQPANMFVNEFIGTTNRLAGRLISCDGSLGRIRLKGGEEFSHEMKSPISAGTNVVVSVRPEGLKIVAPGEGLLAGIVELAMPIGPSTIYDVALADGNAVKVEVPRTAATQDHKEKDQVSIALVGGNTLSIFEGEVSS